MKLSRVAVFGVSLIAIAAVGFYLVQAANGYHGRPEANVTLTMIGNVCHADMANDVGGKRGVAVTWRITNNCSTDQYVSFSNYRQYLSSGFGAVEHDVVDIDRAVTPTAIRAGQPGPPVVVHITKSTLIVELRYKYTVCVGADASTTGNCNDPDFDIWP